METTATRNPQWLRGVLPLCVLGLLVDGESYGYEITRQLAAAGIGDIKGGTLYPVLARLERDGHVTTRWEPTEGGPARKYYRITTGGRDLLAELGADWVEFSRTVNTIIDPALRGAR